jgi:CheY-like chemotaxis protein
MPSKEAKGQPHHDADPWERVRVPASTSAHSGAPVLVVDDDDPVRQSLAQLLHEEGYTVTQARDGIEALRLLRATRARHIIFLDLLMPRMDGIEFCERLAANRALRHDHAVIFMSAWFNHSAPLAAAESARLYKPFDLIEVLELASRFSAAPAR